MLKNDKNIDCQHKGYCALLEGVCTSTDFGNKCRMKDTDVEEMPLIQSIKNRVQRDNERERLKSMHP